MSGESGDLNRTFDLSEREESENETKLVTPPNPAKLSYKQIIASTTAKIRLEEPVKPWLQNGNGTPPPPIPLPFPVSPDLAIELARLKASMFKRYRSSSRKKQSMRSLTRNRSRLSANSHTPEDGSSTSSLHNPPTPWRSYLERNGITGIRKIQAERLKNRKKP